MSVRLPSRRLIRYIRGHFGSSTMCGSRLGGLRGCLSVTLWSFCPLEMSMVAVTLRTASGATLGRFTATLMGVPRSRARCAAFRQRGLQKRAVERCSLNCTPQAAHSLGLFLVGTSFPEARAGFRRLPFFSRDLDLDRSWASADAGRFAFSGPSRTLRERFAQAVPKSGRHLGTVRGLFRLIEAGTSSLKCSACVDFSGFVWSGRRDSNPRPRPWQGRALPLSYTRIRTPVAPWRPDHRAPMPKGRKLCNHP
jgi:hypothetical protein